MDNATQETIQALLDATEPYVEEAAPGEEMNLKWLMRHEDLSRARYRAQQLLEKRAQRNEEREAR